MFKIKSIENEDLIKTTFLSIFFKYINYVYCIEI